MIEDTDSVREVLTRQLEILGVDVTSLADGDRVKRELDKTHFDLVIADLHLPDCSGVDIARFAKAKDCRIILLSGDTNVETRADLINAQFDQILAKPVTLDKLQNILIDYRLISSLNKVVDLSASQSEYDETGAIHLVSLEEQMGELDDVALQMLSRFPHMMKPLVAQIGNAFLNHDMKQVAEISHSLKGAAQSAGAHCLSKVCDNIQNAAQNNQPDEIKIDELEIEFTRVGKALHKLCQA